MIIYSDNIVNRLRRFGLMERGFCGRVVILFRLADGAGGYNEFYRIHRYCGMGGGGGANIIYYIIYNIIIKYYYHRQNGQNRQILTIGSRARESSTGSRHINRRIPVRVYTSIFKIKSGSKRNKYPIFLSFVIWFYADNIVFAERKCLEISVGVVRNGFVLFVFLFT